MNIEVIQIVLDYRSRVIDKSPTPIMNDSNYKYKLQVVSPAPSTYAVDATFSEYGRNKGYKIRRLLLAQDANGKYLKGADVVDTRESYYDNVKDFNVWEFVINDTVLSQLQGTNTYKAGIVISLAEDVRDSKSRNYLGTFGTTESTVLDLPTPTTETKYDYYVCNSINYISPSLNQEFRYNDNVYYDGTTWVKGLNFRIIATVPIFYIPVTSALVEAYEPVETTMTETIVSSLSNIEGQVSTNQTNILNNKNDLDNLTVVVSGKQDNFPTINPEDAGKYVKIDEFGNFYTYEDVSLDVKEVEADITNLENEVSLLKTNKSDIGHLHTEVDITDLDKYTQLEVDTFLADKVDNTTLETHTSDSIIHITSTERTNWNDASSKKHTHANKTVLDGILSTDITNWNTAYNWGDHSTVGYLTSFTESDPIFSSSAASNILSTDITNWNLAYTNNHTHSNKTTLDTISDIDISNWNDKYTQLEVDNKLATKLDTIGGTVNGTLVVTGNLDVQGTTTTINSTETSISDRLIELNSNLDELTAPTGLNSGLTINRGSGTDYGVIYRESSQTFRVGEYDETNSIDNTQAVATREDTPIDNGIAIWDNNTTKFNTESKNTAFNKPFGTTTNTVADGGVLNTHINNSNIHFTSTERTKLSNIEENANNYTHPTTHSIDMIDDSASYVKMTTDERTNLSNLVETDGNYLPLAGGTMTNTLSFNYGNTTNRVLEVYATETNDHGFYWQYTGAESGVDNSLELWTNNSNLGDIRTYRLEQDGVMNFDNTPKVNSNDVYHVGNKPNELVGNTWTTLTTDNGRIDFGPANSSWAHIYAYDNADNPKDFYFNSDLHVLGSKVYHTGNKPSPDEIGALRIDTRTQTYGDSLVIGNYGSSTALVAGEGNATNISRYHNDSEYLYLVAGGANLYLEAGADGDTSPSTALFNSAGDFSIPGEFYAGNKQLYHSGVSTITPANALELDGGRNLDSLIEPGFYYQTANADTGANNYPTDQAGSLLVQRSAGQCTQMYITYDDADVYTRSFYNSWSAWKHVSANTWRGIDDTPVNGQTSQSISSNWAYDHVNGTNPHGTYMGDELFYNGSGVKLDTSLPLTISLPSGKYTSDYSVFRIEVGYNDARGTNVISKNSIEFAAMNVSTASSLGFYHCEFDVPTSTTIQFQYPRYAYLKSSPTVGSTANMFLFGIWGIK